MMLNYVVDMIGGIDNYLGVFVESFYIVLDVGIINVGVVFNVYEVVNGDNDFLNLLG